MIAYKFLASGGLGPFTGFRWPVPDGPAPGPWVSAPDGRAEHGIHACRARDLAFWLDAELWVAELDDPVVGRERQLVAPRARLLERVARWDEREACAFAEACIWRARDRSVAALRGAAATRAAEALASCATLVGLHAVSRSLESRGDLAAALAGYVAESIDFLAAGDAACAAYISARSAVAASSGDENAFADERERQGWMLEERLGLGTRAV